MARCSRQPQPARGWSRRRRLFDSRLSNVVIARSEATKQSILSMWRYGLLRFARNEGSSRCARRPIWHLHDRRLGVEAFDLEAGDTLVVGGDVFQFLQRQHVGDDVVTVGRALF